MPTSRAGIPAHSQNPDIFQLSLGSGGFVTGYFLHESSLAALSIPSFEMSGSALTSFSRTVGKEVGLTKVLIKPPTKLGRQIASGDRYVQTVLSGDWHF